MLRPIWTCRIPLAYVRFGTALALGFGVATAAQASVVTYSGFASTTGLTLVGSAVTTTTTDGTVLRLTPAVGGESGAAYSTSPVTLGSNDIFSTTFSFRFTNPSSPTPADGITFVLAASPSGLGSSGQGLGYGGVTNSLAVEFDTYNNGSGDANSSNHIAIDTNGVLTDTAAAFPYGLQDCAGSGLGCMSNGDLWNVTIGYTGTDLSVAVQDAGNPIDNIITAYPIDIATYLGTSAAYVGFTGSTGGSYENQDIVAWSFANTTQLAPDPVSEPPGVAVLGVGLLVLGVARRRRIFAAAP